jgi:acetyl esterase/lipase
MRLAALAAAIGLCAVLIAPGTAQGDGRYLYEIFPTLTVTNDIVYGQAIDEFGELEDLTLDLYQPAGDPNTNRPVYVWAHGGGFTGGDKSNAPSVNLVRSLARRGYVTASINYRLREGPDLEPGTPEHAQAVFDAMSDGKAAVRWFRANAAAYGIDPDRISFGGYSAGGGIALLVAYTPDFAGESGNPGYPQDVSAVISFAAGTNDSLIDAGEPPVMLVHGTADAVAPYTGSLEVMARAVEVGIPAELHTLVGEGHGVFDDYWDETAVWGASFLYRYVISGGPEADEDGDGCTNEAELGSNPASGGLRNPKAFWDFFDVPTPVAYVRDSVISVSDIAAVISRFGSSRPGGAPDKTTALPEALSPPPLPPAYHAGYDRTPAGMFSGPPDGAIGVQDISRIVAQFGHTCL